MILPQGFHGSPHYFNQILIYDLLSYHPTVSHTLQYTDDLFLCRLSAQYYHQDILNLLQHLDNKVYPLKAQI